MNIKTNYDFIRSLTPEAMARMFAALLHERDMAILERLHEQGVDVSLVEMPFEAQSQIHLDYLLSEFESASEDSE